MGYLLYLMFRCDRRCDGCDGKFGNLAGTKHTPRAEAEKLLKKSLSGSITVNGQEHDFWR